MSDGSTTEIDTTAYPWVYREWLVVADLDGEKWYYPSANVVRFRQVEHT